MESVLDVRQRERRYRRRRLVVIIVIAVTLIGGLAIWYGISSRELDDAQRTAESELREKWGALDLVALSRDYTTTAAIDGDVEGATDLFPTARGAHLLTADFSHAGVVQASYVVTSGGRRGCLAVRVTGDSPPNRVEFRRFARDC